MKALGIIIAMLVAITLLADWARIGYDDSDDWARGERSGMAIYIDHRTGCQYLSRIFGGVTPRLDSNGKQICGDSNEM